MKIFFEALVLLIVMVLTGLVTLFIITGLVGGARYANDIGMNTNCDGYTKNQLDSGDAPLVCYEEKK